MGKHEEGGEVEYGPQTKTQAAGRVFVPMAETIAKIELEWQLIYLEEAPRPLGLLSNQFIKVDES
jgi:hypothetical protein